MCQAVRAPGSKVTMPPLTRAGAVAWNRESTRTAPVKLWAEPALDGCDPCARDRDHLTRLSRGASKPTRKSAATAAAKDFDFHASGLSLRYLASVLLEDFLGDRDRCHRIGPAGIESQVGDRLDELFLGDTVLARQSQVRASWSGRLSAMSAATVTRLRSRFESSGRSQMSP